MTLILKIRFDPGETAAKACVQKYTKNFFHPECRRRRSITLLLVGMYYLAQIPHRAFLSLIEELSAAWEVD